MSLLFEAIKIIFFIITIFLAYVVTQGDMFRGSERTEVISSILLPGYMILVGILLGYVLALFMIASSHDPLRKAHIMNNMFIVGMVMGIIFALLYIFAF